MSAKTMSQEWPVRLYEKMTVLEDDQQVVPKDVMETSTDDESISASLERQAMNVYIPLNDCLNCRVELSRCEIDASTNGASDDSEEDLFAEETNVTEQKEEKSTWSWQEYFDEYEAAYASCQQEEEDFRIAYYDENDFDPAIFLNASLYWIPR